MWKNGAFRISPGIHLSAAGCLLTVPTGSWHAYQLQYKNAMLDAGWLNLGNSIGGNDRLETVTDLAPQTGRFYRIVAY